ncbi:MAG: ATP-binding protein [Alphaproteobacteria bacterium]
MVFIDDDNAFLRTAKGTARTVFRDRLRIVTVHVPEQDPAEILGPDIRARRIDALFIDKNIPGGDANALLEQLYGALPEMNDVPVVIMTAFLGEVDHPEDTLERGTLGYIPKFATAGDAGGDDAVSLLLRQVLVSVPQLRGQIEDTIWTEVKRTVSARVAEDKKLAEIADWVGDALNERFGTCAVYVRTLKEGRLRLLGRDPFKIGPEIESDHFPFLAELTRSNHHHNAVRVNSLGMEDVGPGKPNLLNLRALAAPLMLNGSVLGTIALYRRPERHPFRRKDENHLEHLALQFAAALGRQRDTVRLRERQISLASFIHRISDMTNEEEVAEALVDFLHAEVHDGDNKESKTTLRLINSGTRRIRLLKRLGIEHRADSPEVPIIEWEIDKPDSTYARAIKNRETERHGSVVENVPNGGFYATAPGINSVLTVPLLAAELSIGACNLESLRKDRYSIEDQAFVEALARASATVMVKLRSQNFLMGIVELLNRLVELPDIAATEEALERAFRLLIQFSGCARLLYLVPDDAAGTDAPWRIQRVLDEAGNTVPESTLAEWQKETQENWKSTFFFRTLNNPTKFYTEDRDDFHGDEGRGVPTQAIQIVLLRRNCDDNTVCPPSGMLEMLFVMPGAVNITQRKLLEVFGQFIGWLLEVGRDIRKMLNERTLQKQLEATSLVLGQFRHSLKTPVGSISNVVARARQFGDTSEWVGDVQEALREIDREIENSKYLIKVPEISEANISELIEFIVNHARSAANEKGIDISFNPFETPLFWCTDAIILRTILDNLIQNSIASCRSGDSIHLEIRHHDNKLVLKVVDTGPGISASMRDRLFQRGSTTRPTGTGFGLYFAKIRAKDLGGDLVWNKEHSPGASFTITLP